MPNVTGDKIVSKTPGRVLDQDLGASELKAVSSIDMSPPLKSKWFGEGMVEHADEGLKRLSIFGNKV
jgi:hypothetical protein